MVLLGLGLEPVSVLNRDVCDDAARERLEYWPGPSIPDEVQVQLQAETETEMEAHGAGSSDVGKLHFITPIQMEVAQTACVLLLWLLALKLAMTLGVAVASMFQSKHTGYSTSHISSRDAPVIAELQHTIRAMADSTRTLIDRQGAELHRLAQEKDELRGQIQALEAELDHILAAIDAAEVHTGTGTGTGNVGKAQAGSARRVGKGLMRARADGEDGTGMECQQQAFLDSGRILDDTPPPRSGYDNGSGEIDAHSQYTASTHTRERSLNNSMSPLVASSNNRSTGGTPIKGSPAPRRLLGQQFQHHHQLQQVPSESESVFGRSSRVPSEAGGASVQAQAQASERSPQRGWLTRLVDSLGVDESGVEHPGMGHFPSPPTGR